jgi:hypothetical protein
MRYLNFEEVQDLEVDFSIYGVDGIYVKIEGVFYNYNLSNGNLEKLDKKYPSAFHCKSCERAKVNDKRNKIRAGLIKDDTNEAMVTLFEMRNTAFIIKGKKVEVFVQEKNGEYFTNNGKVTDQELLNEGADKWTIAFSLYEEKQENEATY